MDLSENMPQVIETTNVLRDAIKQAGGPHALGRLIGLTGPAVTNWGRVQCVPFEFLPVLAQRSSYSVRELMDAIAAAHPKYAALALHIGPGKRPYSKRALDKPTDPRQLGIASEIRL